jgi:type IV pilus assembly protein PilB
MSPEMDIADLLLKQGMITPEQLAKAREEIKRTGLKLPEALEKLGFISEEDIAKVKAEVLGVSYIDLTGYLIDTELTKLIPEDTARKHKAVPLFKIKNSLTVGMLNPEDIEAIDYIRRISKIDIVEPVLVTEKGLRKILDSYYGAGGTVEEIVKVVDKIQTDKKEQETLVQVTEVAPVVKLVNVIIIQAAKDRASDIHFEPEENILRVRYRIDGVLHEVNALPKKLQSPVISRVKLLSGMDIAENRKPQDGRVRLKLENKDLDIRVSTFPTVHGENVVMRLLDKSAVLFGPKELGFSEEALKTFDKVIRNPHGIILVTGPTGSGKTTTLYAALTSISSMEKNIITIEDPVEFELPLIRQTQVNIKAGITFANGLRSILRQDPDIIMVGEIRDLETVEIAIQAALTGHLVLSTLHTNDAPSALTRLIDMGIEPFLISSSVTAIVAQRLVRLICDNCKEKHIPPDTLLEDLGVVKGQEFYRGRGCEKCKNTGFLGRVGIFELLIVNEEIRKMVNQKVSAGQIKKKAAEFGMKMLREDGLEKAARGLTTLDEVLRVTEVELEQG